MDYHDDDEHVLEVNGRSFAEFKSQSTVARRLESVLTEYSHICKQCILDSNLWCPTSNYKAGYCCSGVDVTSCPRATTCSDSYIGFPELQYMTCPNEDTGCIYDRNMSPPLDGTDLVIEKLTGEFFERDVCTFIIKNPSSSDLNDMTYLQVEYQLNCFPVLIKAPSLTNTADMIMYYPKVGQVFSAPKG